MLDDVRRGVLIDIAYEVGGAGLAQFVNLLTACRYGQWSPAAVALMNSKLFQQVPMREHENITALATGEWPPGVTCAQELIKRHEGCKLMPSPDAKGMWSVGWGHDLPPPLPGTAVAEWSQAACDAQFEADFALAQDRAMVDLGQEYW